MSVHIQIKEQMTNFINAEKRYRELDQKREELIEAVLAAAKQKKEFSLEEVNVVTEEMNNLSRSFRFPLRKKVTTAMVAEYIARS